MNKHTHPAPSAPSADVVADLRRARSSGLVGNATQLANPRRTRLMQVLDGDLAPAS